MADHPLTFFDSEDAPGDTDLTYVLADPAGTPADKKLQWINVRNQASASAGLPTGATADDILYWNSGPEWHPIDYVELDNVADITIAQVGTADINGLFFLNFNWDNLTGGINLIPEALYMVQFSINGGEFWHKLIEIGVTADGSNVDFTYEFQPATTIKARIRTADFTESNHSAWLESNTVTVV